MIIKHMGLSSISGSLVVLDGCPEASYEEVVEMHLDDGSTRMGRVVQMGGEGGRPHRRASI